MTPVSLSLETAPAAEVKAEKCHAAGTQHPIRLVRKDARRVRREAFSSDARVAGLQAPSKRSSPPAQQAPDGGRGQEFVIPGDRDAIRKRATAMALHLLRRLLTQNRDESV